MRKTAVEQNALSFSEEDGVIKITAGDTAFQETLTEVEKDYIHKGMNWISKLGRETSLKSLHYIGYTLDDVYALPEDKQQEIWDKANEAWNDSFA